MIVYGVTGWKNAGKTGLMERLVAHMCGLGYRVSTIKHAHHDTDIDQPGRDSFRHRQAGAAEVVLSSPRRWAIMHELRDAPEPTLEDLLARMTPVDLVLIEGFKNAPHPKIEAHRAQTGRPFMALDRPAIRAVAADTRPANLSVPVFDLNDTDAIADFLLRDAGMIP